MDALEQFTEWLQSDSYNDWMKGEVNDMSETKASNPKDRAASAGGRVDLSLFPMTAVVYGSLGMTEGDAKYGGFNWRVAGVSVSTYVAAAMRHLFKYYNGEWDDKATKVPHLASALACLAIIVDARECGKLVDDRPPVADMADLLARASTVVKHLHTLFPDGPERYTVQPPPPAYTFEEQEYATEFVRPRGVE